MVQSFRLASLRRWYINEASTKEKISRKTGIDPADLYCLHFTGLAGWLAGNRLAFSAGGFSHPTGCVGNAAGSLHFGVSCFEFSQRSVDLPYGGGRGACRQLRPDGRCFPFVHGGSSLVDDGSAWNWGRVGRGCD